MLLYRLLHLTHFVGFQAHNLFQNVIESRLGHIIRLSTG